MRGLLTIAVCGLILAACGTGGGGQPQGGTPPETDSSPATVRIDTCVDRLLSRAPTSDAGEQESRRYIRDTYCALFEQNGWVYEDGALTIAAQNWLDNGYAKECSTSGETTPARTVPCEAERIIDCALLHHIRRTEAQSYIADRQRGSGDVQCDGDTPVAELGAP